MTGITQLIAKPARYTFLAALIALGLNGCSSSPPQTDSSTITGSETQSQAIDVHSLLQRAQQSYSPQKEQLLLQAAMTLDPEQDLAWARNLLSSIDITVLSEREYSDYALLFSQLAMEDAAYFLAQRILTNPRLQRQWQRLSNDEQITLRERRADLFMLLGETHASVEERLALQSLLAAEVELDTQNQDNLWQSLMTMPSSELHYRSSNSQNLGLRGWYELALISKDNQGDLDKQLTHIHNWVARWPDHPASLRLPKDLQLLQQLISERPQQVALLLPQSGPLAKAGKAIRDGFIAAYYQAQSQGGTIPTLKVYDSNQGLLANYQQAVDEGSELIIGPLGREQVSQLSQLDQLPVPTLAVNYSEDSEPAENLYQFGLSAEDEARQVAQRAWVEGHRTAMILTTNASWGTRSAIAFTQAWEQLGGTVVNTSEFRGNGDYSNVVKSALYIEDSQERSRALSQLFGERFEYEPRRRQDIDMIFLVARPSDARQIKPTLAFHYAGKLPVYGSSHIYSGVEDRKNDRDLNGVIFSTLPWVFSHDSPEKQAMNQASKPAPSYQRLYALGVDSFQLYPRLKQLRDVPQARFYGVTGSLHMNQQRRIEREQVWAVIRGGRARLMPTVVTQHE